MLPWETVAAQIDPANKIGMDPNGPEALLASQLYVHGVRLFPGYIPWVIVRYRMRTAVLKGATISAPYFAAECDHHKECNYTRRASAISRAAVSLQPDVTQIHLLICRTGAVHGESGLGSYPRQVT